MMPLPIWFALPGAAIGLAIACAVAVIARPAPIRLTAALARLDAHTRLNATNEDATRGHVERLLVPLAARAARSSNRWWGIPDRDLDACGLTATRYVARRATWAGAGVSVAVAFWLILLAAGISVPAAGVVIAIGAGGVLGSVVPVLDVAETAAKRRDEFRRAIAAYLDLIAQERASGAAAGQALIEAARVADSWPFQRMHATLVRAEHAGDTPWDALTRLADRMGVPELGDVADIAATAADGAAIYTALTAQAQGLRRATIAADKAGANSRSQRLALPVTLLLIALLLLVIYPAFIRLLAT